MIKQFDRTNLKTLRAEIDTALALVAKKHGITLNTGRITFNATTFSTKIKAETSPAGKTDTSVPTGVNPTWVKAFRTNAYVFGLTPSDLGRAVTLAGKHYVIVGARPKANLQIVVQRATGGCIAAGSTEVALALKSAKV